MRKRSYIIAIFASLLIATVILYFLFEYSPIKKMNGITEVLLSPFSKFTIRIFTPEEIKGSKIAELEKENQRLREEITKLELMKKDSKALRDQFESTTITSRKLLPAYITGMRTFIPGITLPDEIIIDKGKKSGVVVGESVVVGDTLIGKITKTSDHLSAVTLITSPTSLLTADTINTGAIGIIHGKGNGQMRFENVLLTDRLEKNDTIITKGDLNNNGIGFPQGLEVGKISAVSKKASDLFQSAEVRSLVNISKQTIVFVLTSNE